MTEFTHPSSASDISLVLSRGIRNFYTVNNSRFAFVHYHNMSGQHQVNHIEVVDADMEDDYIFFAIHPENNGQSIKIFPSDTRDIDEREFMHLLHVAKAIIKVEDNADIIVTPRLKLSPEEMAYYFRDNQVLLQTVDKLNQVPSTHTRRQPE